MDGDEENKVFLDGYRDGGQMGEVSSPSSRPFFALPQYRQSSRGKSSADKDTLVRSQFATVAEGLSPGNHVLHVELSEGSSSPHGGTEFRIISSEFLARGSAERRVRTSEADLPVFFQRVSSFLSVIAL